MSGIDIVKEVWVYTYGLESIYLNIHAIVSAKNH